MAIVEHCDARALFAQLSCDSKREELYRKMICQTPGQEKILKFQSRVLVEDARHYNEEDRAKIYRQDAYLVCHPDHLQEAYTKSATSPIAPADWSNTPFQGLGGTFMLAIDEPVIQNGVATDAFVSHDAQRKYCYDYLEKLKPFFDPIATVAFRMGALLPLKSREFDLAALAEQVSVRYMALLFGFPQSDLKDLTEIGRQIGRGLQYQMMARHFVTDPATIPTTKQALARLVARTGDLLDIYRQPIGKTQIDLQADLFEEQRKLRNILFEKSTGSLHPKGKSLADFSPLIQRMAGDTSQYSVTEKAILVAGLVGGAVTNIRASICIAVKQFLNLPAGDLKSIYECARDARSQSPNADWSNPKNEQFRAYVEEAMRLNPPAAFIPRRAADNLKFGSKNPKDWIPAGSLIILGVGGGSWLVPDDNNALCASPPVTRFRMRVQPSQQALKCPFSMVFGGPPDKPAPALQPTQRAAYTHSCFGKDMAMHVVTHAVRQVMILPGLSQSLDEETGKPKSLTKLWGYYCESYPLEYHREKLLRQQPLQTVLNVKNPVPENAAALKQILAYGAPFIEKVLQDSKVVHFASFLFIDNESKLVLFTAYDGEFDPYIAHFAREFGPLFDRFFEHIESSPPMPIKKHAYEFVEYLKLFSKPPVGGLFISAYPETQAAAIKSHFNKDRKFELFEIKDDE